MTKLERQLRIKELISQGDLSSQHDLLEQLKASGFFVTQATLSRDCADLGVVRVPTSDGYKLMIPLNGEKQAIRSLIGVEILNVISNEVMALVKTLAGRASGVASFIDGLESPDIIGTVAGDDTVLVIPKSIHDIPKIVKFIQDKISESD